jgi:predicted molibdopterin-dependent oxidoreductase YjgC
VSALCRRNRRASRAARCLCHGRPVGSDRTHSVGERKKSTTDDPGDESPELLKLLTEYAAEPQRFKDSIKRKPELIDDNPVYVRDYAKCVLCWRCVQVCAEDAQYTYAINFSGRGFNTSIDTFFDRPLPETVCVFCGQCVGVCPTGALKAKRELLLEQGVAAEDVFELTQMQGRGKQSRRGPHLDDGGIYD